MRPYNFILNDGEEIEWWSYIHWVDDYGTNRLVGRVSFIINIPDIQRYVIEYFDDCLDYLLANTTFMRIPGCGHYEGKRVWIYPNGTVPLFIDERSLNPKRSDTYEVLKHFGLEYNDRFEYFNRSGGICSNNTFFLYKKEDSGDFHDIFLHELRFNKRK